jgi:hypothetical protein
MALKMVVTTRKNMARTWEQRMRIAPPLLRQAVGKNTRLVFQRRKQLLEETIYQRAPVDRPLTGNLKDSEYVQQLGNVARIGNRAPYAQIRHDMTGQSAKYGHDKTSRWAERAVQETAGERHANVRAAMRRILSQG